MNTSNLAKGIFIGDNTLAGYVEIIKNINIDSGLFDKTTDIGIRKINTKANFPRTASYYYIQEKIRETSVDSKRFFYGNLVSGYNIDGLDIGWAYTTDINEHKVKIPGYASVADFDNFQSLLRDESLNRGSVDTKGHNIHVSTKYKGYELPNIRIENYNGENFENTTSLNIGENYSVNYNFDNYREKHDNLRKYAEKNIKNLLSKNRKNIQYEEYGFDRDNVKHLSLNEDNKYKSKKVIFNEGARTETKEYKEYEKGGGLISSGDFITKNIIEKTNTLFKEHKINTLVNRFENSEVSRGRKLKGKSKTSKDGYKTDYCRVWTANHQYKSMKDTIRPFHNDDSGKAVSLTDVQKKLTTSMRPNDGATRLGDNSVLQKNGFVRITPQKDGNGKAENIKNYMFSIENLAWKDKKHLLSKEQQGPNDGRIMWFPPYNLKFTENVNVNWNANNFIGRGEQIYTYTNTERSGTLNFTLLIDHPSILNEWSPESKDLKTGENELLRFFAGDKLLDKSSKTKEGNILVYKEIKEDKTPKLQYEEKKVAFVVFFPTLYSGVYEEKLADVLKKIGKYETTSDGTETEYKDFTFLREKVIDINKCSLNTQTGISMYEDTIKNFINEGEGVILKPYIGGLVNDDFEIIAGDVGKQGDTIFDVKHGTIKKAKLIMAYSKNENKLLVNRRHITIDKILNECKLITHETYTVTDRRLLETVAKDHNAVINKMARMAIILFTIAIPNNRTAQNQNMNSESVAVNGENLAKGNSYEVKSDKTFTLVRSKNADNYSAYDNEYLHFLKISEDNKFKSSILKRVKHFNPAYHSLTPEGFNARLTFLHQCTRQGPTAEIGSGNSQGEVSDEKQNYVKYASNLSFGRAPYCILKIGDFFNTKICIDSISIDYDNGGGPQWDLNPEGVGVQPMLANVSLNFKFIGGQDIAGPIAKLQNAISSNYYANASIYDYHADIAKKIKNK